MSRKNGTTWLKYLRGLGLLLFFIFPTYTAHAQDGNEEDMISIDLISGEEITDDNRYSPPEAVVDPYNIKDHGVDGKVLEKGEDGAEQKSEPVAKLVEQHLVVGEEVSQETIDNFRKTYNIPQDIEVIRYTRNQISSLYTVKEILSQQNIIYHVKKYDSQLTKGEDENGNPIKQSLLSRVNILSPSYITHISEEQLEGILVTLGVVDYEFDIYTETSTRGYNVMHGINHFVTTKNVPHRNGSDLRGYLQTELSLMIHFNKMYMEKKEEDRLGYSPINFARFSAYMKHEILGVYPEYKVLFDELETIEDNEEHTKKQEEISKSVEKFVKNHIKQNLLRSEIDTRFLSRGKTADILMAHYTDYLLTIYYQGDTYTSQNLATFVKNKEQFLSEHEMYHELGFTTQSVYYQTDFVTWFAEKAFKIRINVYIFFLNLFSNLSGFVEFGKAQEEIKNPLDFGAMSEAVTTQY